MSLIPTPLALKAALWRALDAERFAMAVNDASSWKAAANAWKAVANLARGS
jgi:hypothetical protein